MLKRFAGVLAIVLASCVEQTYATTPRPTQPDALGADWLDGESTIRATHVERLLALGRADPEVTSLVREAVRVLGNGRIDGLAARFSPCPATAGSPPGRTVVNGAIALIPRSLQEIALGQRSPITEAHLAAAQNGRAREVRVTTEADFIRVERTFLPDICIASRLSIVEAYEAVVHELVHALRLSPHARTHLAATAKTKAAFDLAMVLLPGGEVEAYTVSWRARMRIPDRGLRMWRGLRFINPYTLQLATTPDVLARAILAPPPEGLGYAEGTLASTFEEAKHALDTETTEVRSLLDATLAERRANIAVYEANLNAYTHNIAAYHHNLRLAESTANRQLAVVSRAGIAEAERGLAETRALLDAGRASETRLVADLASVDAVASASTQ